MRTNFEKVEPGMPELPPVEYPIRPVRPPFHPPIPWGRFFPPESKIPKGGWREVPRGVYHPPESTIPKGGWREWFPSFRDTYRTLDGLHFFEFEFHPMTEGHIEVDIINMPSYPSHLAGDPHKTHVLPSNHGNEHRICFGDASAINTLETAQEYAGIWAENTMKLIKENRPFPNV